uniref:Poly(A)-specific ribonuclease n=1 Tax=Rhabditophanes sp. KR3021 TaxID=114890 RepID=A0AC35U233_9BILA
MVLSQEAVKQNEVNVINVWQHNIRQEFALMRKHVQHYPYVAMDTEFPGVVATPVGNFLKKEKYNYHQVCCNVNMLKLIQVGLTFMNEKGELPTGNPVYQFNFHFNLEDDMYSTESIELLSRCGLDFDRHMNEGISMSEFGEILTTSGLVTDPRVKWLTYSAGYDFGYLIKAILTKGLPDEESEFDLLLAKLFPTSIDIKSLLMADNRTRYSLRGGLQEIAMMLDIERYGQQHQAGSDSLLTGATYFTLRKRFFSETYQEVIDSVIGKLYGLGDTLSGQDEGTPSRPTSTNKVRTNILSITRADTVDGDKCLNFA